ncbi:MULTISPECIES: carbohydrate ABC transporter permease [unclassified Mesorhizobium]|uniref:carbohydrate ABC transporter permease n=1 Tax=unclassified Mesorhizobium TaxID=325217 RepID=UPI00112B483A|nr:MULTISPECIES: carbohydrate ABC transporter permease [unclassified Mesorhizobium]TPL02154.1 carbohydrate ABC transporter permease [Mesorhizobium sp. B2-4-16]TPL57394.1 carbohydrate ABC transporter permease [Mesorhizobium sp. B2-4-3]
MQHQYRVGWWTYALVIATGLVILAPFAWMVATGVMTTGQTLQVPPSIIPAPTTLAGTEEVFDRIPFLTLLLNTILVSTGRAIFTLVVCSMAAYALAIIKVPGSQVILILILALLMVPGDIFIVPNFAIIASFRMTDTLVALFLPSVFDVFGVFLLYQFFRGVPRELVEAARMDGASHLRILTTIVVPVARSGVVSLAILTVLSEWKDLLWPIVVNRSLDKLTLGPGLALLRGTYTTDWNVVMAAGVMAALPMIVIFLILQKQFIASFARSGLK